MPDQALEIEPGLAGAWHALGLLDAELGNMQQAAGSFRRAIKADATLVAARVGLANVLRRAGQKKEADVAMAEATVLSAESEPTAAVAATDLGLSSVEAYEQRITLDAGQRDVQFALAVMKYTLPPAQLPSSSLVKLFDEYADRFEQHLTEKLQYHVPEMMAAALSERLPKRPVSVLDLGCGTGLVGSLLRPMASTLVGIDLSPGMIEKAHGRGIYDRLEVADALAGLRAAAPASYDVLASADVLIYIGDLSEHFEAAAAALRPGGIFAYTVESTGEGRYSLHPRTVRYRHSASYLKHLATIYGFEEVLFNPITVRTESNHPVPGFLSLIRLP